MCLSVLILNNFIYHRSDLFSTHYCLTDTIFMAELKRQNSKENNGGPPGPQKVELDRIKLPPETLESQVPDSPIANDASREKPSEQNHASIENSPADLQPAISQEPPQNEEATLHDTRKLTKEMRFFLAGMVGITAAVWIFAGILYLFYRMFFR